MAYVEGRVVHDADSHIMETSEMLADFASEKVKRHRLVRAYLMCGTVATAC